MSCLLEWSGVTGGPPAEVVLRLHPSPTPAFPAQNTRFNLSTEIGEQIDFASYEKSSH